MRKVYSELWVCQVQRCPYFEAEETDPNTGKTVGWEPIEQSPFAKFHAEALGDSVTPRPRGTYELIGPKINGNPEGYDCHILMAHADAARLDSPGLPRHPNLVRAMVQKNGLTGWEGVVWHHPDGRMAKLKARDYRP